MKRVHTSLAGHRIEFDEPAAKVTAFLSRLEKMVADPCVTENEMIGVLYSKENPVLDSSVFPERGAVTHKVLEDPLYAVQQDLLFRKRVAIEGTDLDKLAAAHNLSLKAAAKEIGITESSLRTAIYDRRLSSWIKEGQHYVTRAALRSFDASRKAPKAAKPGKPSEAAGTTPADALGGPLDVCSGLAEGLSLKLKFPGELTGRTRVKGNIITGRIPTWRRVAVLSGTSDGGARLFVLTPSENENEIKVGPFFVRGHFDAVKENQTVRARKNFDAFVAE